MYRIAMIMISAVVMGCSSSKPLTAGSPDSAASQLKQRMEKFLKRGYMFGHQDDPVYGTTWKWDMDKSDTKLVCGDYPAVMGFDLGKLELGSDVNIDGVPFSRMRDEIIRQHLRGGILTLSWHPWNPVTGGNSWDVGGNAVAAILEGGAQHETLNRWLDYAADFLNSLVTDKGEKVPVIFRPWHEMSGAWFWWGSGSCTPEQYRRLFRYTHYYLTGKGCDNLLWAYSPNSEADATYERYMQYYPGDDVVDLLGLDAYQFSSDDTYVRQLDHMLQLVERAGKEHNKLIALTETGYQNVPDPHWFTGTLKPVIDRYPICYVLLWRNAWDKETENYGPAPGKACNADFIKFYNASNTLFINDIK